jgi:hypothetical protein
MNPSILRILKISLILASSAFAETESDNFPALGKTYDVTWAESARQVREQIKVLRKGEGSWIFVESCYLYSRPQQPSQPGSDAPRGVKLEKGPTKKKWINTRWLIDASEPEAEK